MHKIKTKSKKILKIEEQVGAKETAAKAPWYFSMCLLSDQHDSCALLGEA